MTVNQFELPELRALASPRHLIRLPPGDEVPLTKRVMRILDTAPMRRLSRVSQLGLVAQVYPGAVHTRFEHSLGVYRNALLFLQRLSYDSRFLAYVTPRDAEALMVAALVHDIGHWPFCHPIEDLGLPDLPEHEYRARQILSSSEITECFREDWSIEVEDVLRILEGHGTSPGDQLLASLMSSPLDIDKLDYLQRDSLHAGVPYGRNFDAQRLIGALCVHPDQPKLAITDKGRTAAEMMVFSRYIMFSEVYWHHAVRSATAMLQRAVWLLRDRIDLQALCRCDDHEWISQLQRTADGTKAESLVDGLFGSRRKLFKRGAEFNVLDQPELHQQLARRPYDRLVIASERLAARIAEQTKLPLGAADVIIDAPPVKLEVDISMDVLCADGTVRNLGTVSPVVQALAKNQFDNQVKRVRVFLRADVRSALGGKLPLDWIRESL